MSSSTKEASLAHNNASGDSDQSLRKSTSTLHLDNPVEFRCYSRKCLGCLVDLEELDKAHRTTFTSCPACDVPRHSYRPRADNVGSRNVFFQPSLEIPPPSRLTGLFDSHHPVEEQRNPAVGSCASPNDDQRTAESSPAPGLANRLQGTALETRAYGIPTSGQTLSSDPSSTPFIKSFFGAPSSGADRAPSNKTTTSSSDAQRRIRQPQIQS